MSYKLIVTSFGLLIPSSIYSFSKSLYKYRKVSIINTILLLIPLISLPGYLGFDFDGLLDYGLAPSFISIPMMFYYLSLLFNKKSSIKRKAIVLSVLILTHLLTAVIACLITVLF